MKAITNGKFILPDERGDFFISEGGALTFGEKILELSVETDVEEILDVDSGAAGGKS